MNQVLVILRGASASGKTTLAENLRDFDRKIAWLSVDKMKPIFNSEEKSLNASSKVALATLKYLLEEGYSIIFDGIFKNTNYVYEAIKIAKNRDIPCIVYQLKCSLNTLQKRDKNRKGVKEGYRKPLGNTMIESLHKKNIDNPIEGAIELDTESQSSKECLEIIRKNFD